MHQSTKRLWYFMCCILFIRLQLEKYLDLADKSEYRYLKENAEEIRKIME